MRLIKLFLFLLILGPSCWAQVNIQNYTPSILLDRGEFEIKSFQNLYTQTKSFGNSAFEKVKIPSGRQTYFTSINQVTFGLNDRINFGWDVWIKNVNYADPNLNPRTGISATGPRIKVNPFKNLGRFSIQSSFLLPIASDLEAPLVDQGGPFPFLEFDRNLWLTQLFYDLPLNDQFQLFFQQAFWYSLVKRSFRQNNFWQTQSSVFLSYFPSNRWTLYGMTEYFPTHYDDQEQKFKAFNKYFVQSGLGAKYQLILNTLELELLYTNFWAGSTAEGAGHTFNLGIRYIHQ